MKFNTCQDPFMGSHACHVYIDNYSLACVSTKAGFHVGKIAHYLIRLYMFVF